MRVGGWGPLFRTKSLILLLEFSFSSVRPFVCPHFLHASYIVVIMAWVTRPERPKAAKDEVKQARRAPNQKFKLLVNQ